MVAYNRVGEFKFASEGPAGARPLIMVPGFGHDAHWYADYAEAIDRVFERLNVPHEQFALRMRRYRELVSWPHSIAGWVRILEDFIDEAAVREQNDGLEPIIIGHSMGGVAAWEYALKHGGPLGMVAPLVPIKDSFRQLFNRGIKTNADLLKGQSGPAGIEYARSVRWAYTKRFFASPVNRVLLMKDALNYAFPEGITDNPTLIVRAVHDGLFKDAPAQNELPSKFSNATVIDYSGQGYKGCHDLPMVDPEWLAELLAPWIIEQENVQRKNAKKRKRAA